MGEPVQCGLVPAGGSKLRKNSHYIDWNIGKSSLFLKVGAQEALPANAKLFVTAEKVRLYQAETRSLVKKCDAVGVVISIALLVGVSVTVESSVHEIA
jgi:hypothetical protein